MMNDLHVDARQRGCALLGLLIDLFLAPVTWEPTKNNDQNCDKDYDARKDNPGERRMSGWLSQTEGRFVIWPLKCPTLSAGGDVWPIHRVDEISIRGSQT